MQTFIHKMNSACFDWLTWRSGNILEVFNVKHRYYSIVENKSLIRKHAIGFCLSIYTPCRVKEGYVCVMFETDFRQWWTHFTVREFNACFPEHSYCHDKNTL
jgi:hypothetical protein